jgi:hypothetical protein
MNYLVLSAHHKANHHPLPPPFGQETYGKTVISIGSYPNKKEFNAELSKMESDLVYLTSDLQIILIEWEKCFLSLKSLEHSKKTLPLSAPQITRDVIEKNLIACKEHLTMLQEQRDAYNVKIANIHKRISEIKIFLEREAQLDRERMVLAERVREKYSAQDEFWKTKFDPRVSHNHNSLFLERQKSKHSAF